MSTPPRKLDPESAMLAAAQVGVTLSADSARGATSMSQPIADADATLRKVAFEAEPASFLVVHRTVRS
jgi:hypothetical protein